MSLGLGGVGFWVLGFGWFRVWGITGARAAAKARRGTFRASRLTYEGAVSKIRAPAPNVP